jgi:hypothetical protein
MPFVKETDIGVIQTLPTPEITQEPEAEGPAVGETIQAAFEVENSLVSMAANGFGFHNFQTEEGYDPFDGDLEGYEMWADSFVESKSREHTAAIKNQIDHQLEKRQTLEAAGALGWVAQIAAGMTDPLYWPMMLIPGGAAVKGSKTVGQAAGRLAVIGGVSEIPAEAAKQYSQETRTGFEAMAAIGGATVLSGLLGGAAKALTTKEIDTIAAKLDDVLSDAPTEISSGNSLSMGAARTVELTKEQLQPVSVGGVESWGVSPNIRLENSPSTKSRSIVAEMMESATVKQAHIDGIATAPSGGSAETRIKLWNEGIGQALTDLDEFYKAYRGGRGTTSRLVNDYVMFNRAGKMTPKEFREAVGRANRRGDRSDIPEVQQAAESFRKNVFDPLKDAAIREGLLPPDVNVTTAASYLTRVYKTERIIAKRDEWNGILESWLRRGRDDARLVDNPTEQQLAEAAMTDREIRAIVDDITDNILGVASGRSHYEVVSNVRGPMKERTFNAPDSLIEDYLESDIDITARQYTRTMAPDVEISRLYGDANMQQQLDEVRDSYNELIRQATTEKQRIKLHRQLKNDKRDIEAIRDRLRGTYRQPEDPDAFFIRGGKTIRDVNFMRMLGGMTLSAIPDLARPVAVNGLKPVARGLKALIMSPEVYGMAKAEAKKAAVGWDMVLNGRVASVAELTDIYNKGSTFERVLRSASDVFSKLTLMSQWNTALKNFSGVVTQDRILGAVVDVAEGRASKSTIKRLASSGIGEDQAKAIARQFSQFGDDGSLRLSNGHLWENKDALETFRAAVLKDVDRAIMTPGEGEKPLWTSSEMGKMVFQFKTFAATAHNKILIADLQYRDAEALNGFLLSVALGGVAYGAKEFFAGREISTDPEKLIVESLDRSGAFGYFWDVNNIAEKATRGQIGVNKLIGADPMSRYASRNLMGALLGPSMGTVEDLATVTGAVSQGEFTESDLRRVRKLLPGQNLFYIRQLLNSLEEDIGAEL